MASLSENSWPPKFQVSRFRMRDSHLPKKYNNCITRSHVKRKDKIKIQSFYKRTCTVKCDVTRLFVSKRFIALSSWKLSVIRGRSRFFCSVTISYWPTKLAEKSFFLLNLQNHAKTTLAFIGKGVWGGGNFTHPRCWSSLNTLETVKPVTLAFHSI